MGCLPLLFAALLPLLQGSQAPVQTPWQSGLFARVQSTARRASALATPALLARLNSTEVREALRQCCPAVSMMPAEEILSKLRAEIAASEVVSGFNARDGPRGMPFFDFSLSEAEGGSHFESLWEVWVRHGVQIRNWTTGMDDVETGFYGLRPFAQRGNPKSISEAKERAPYCFLNIMGIDAGSPLYGDVSLVLSPQAARSTSLLAPFDTGSWSIMCNSSMKSPPAAYDHDCSAFQGSAGLGTLQDFDHLLLANEKYWANASSLIRKLERLFSPSTEALKGQDFVHYIEALPAGEIRFPEHIKFVIASFPSLFGTAVGERLRAWCRRQSWMLIWSLGLNVGLSTEGMPLFWKIKDAPGTFASNNRLVDALVVKHTTVNVSVETSDEVAFNSSWQQSAAARAAGNGSVEPAAWGETWTRLRAQVSADLRVFPLRAGGCEDIENCMGISETGHCLCKVAPAEQLLVL
eukprot:TRINITY_DN34314_c0_g1_i1.p1 TRINITY_DN34314_c0_g1~~TRINITY_DN34314_c0_g1_i1.p1  ORF type:complete len:465 (-),score=83.94 TRINITY_DN34314_c0_g1_i1:26-1420(-)